MSLLNDDELFAALDADIQSIADAKADAESCEVIVSMANAIEQAVSDAVVQKLATVSVEPVQFEEWNAKQHGDPEEIGFLQALRIAYCSGQDSMKPALAAARVQAIEEAAKICECQWSTLEERDAGIEFAEAIRALIGGCG